MKQRWYVIDSQEHSVTWNEKTERGHAFNTKAAAMKHAAEHAEDEPHKAFLVCPSIDYVVVETRPVIAKPCTR